MLFITFPSVNYTRWGGMYLLLTLLVSESTYQESIPDVFTDIVPINRGLKRRSTHGI
jgi:hypothetical protein